MSKGPALDFSKIDVYARLDGNLRIITDYLSAHDSIITRFDFKIENRQYAIAFASSTPKEPIAGEHINMNDDLVTPKHVIQCLNLKVSKQQVIAALKELVNDLEND